MRTRAFLTSLAVGAVLLSAAPRLLAQSGAAAASPAPAKFVSAPAGSVIRVDGDSTLHKWHVASASVEGTLLFNPADLGGAWTVPPKADARIQTKSVKSEEGGGMDKKTWESLQADKFPVISYRLLEAGAPKVVEAGKKWTIPCRGEWTVAGKAAEFKFDLTVTKEGNGYLVTGSVATKMTAFGITPPKAMAGMVKAKDEIVITITWKLVAAP